MASDAVVMHGRTGEKSEAEFFRWIGMIGQKHLFFKRRANALPGFDSNSGAFCGAGRRAKVEIFLHDHELAEIAGDLIVKLALRACYPGTILKNVSEMRIADAPDLERM